MIACKATSPHTKQLPKNTSIYWFLQLVIGDHACATSYQSSWHPTQQTPKNNEKFRSSVVRFSLSEQNMYAVRSSLCFCCGLLFRGFETEVRISNLIIGHLFFRRVHFKGRLSEYICSDCWRRGRRKNHKMRFWTLCRALQAGNNWTIPLSSSAGTIL